MSRPHLVLAAFALASLGFLPSARAGGVNFILVGPAINGVVPTGTAAVDQSKLQQGDPGTIKLEVKNVNLPDNTQLNVVIAFTHVATVTVVSGQGRVEATLPLVEFAFGPDVLEVKLGQTDILVGTTQR